MEIYQKHLQELLDERNLTKKQLAKAVGISTSAINGYFHKNLYPIADIAIKIAHYFACSLDYLLGLSEIKDFDRSTQNRTFIENYNILLKQKGISIAKSLRDMNMGDKNYTIWKKGKLPKTYNLIQIAKYFNTTIDFLLGRGN